MTRAEAVLEGGSRCLLATRGPRGPLVVPAAYWYDGEGLWTVATAGAPQVRALRRDGGCAVHVRTGEGAVVARGRARVLSLREPLGLVVRAPAIAGAMAALALRHPSSLAVSARDAVGQPWRLGPQNLAVVHVRLSGIVAAAEVEPASGIAPPLPPAIPADVRRALAGARRVVIARQDAGASGLVEMVPGWWDRRYALVCAAGGRPLAGSEPIAVALDSEPDADARGGRGLVLSGRTRAGVLEAERATFWRGYGIESVDLPPAHSELILPD